MHKVSRKDLAQVLGLTERRVAQLHDAGHICHPNDAGDYDLPDAVQGYVAFVRSTTGSELNAARTEKLALEKDLLQLTLAERRRELIPAQEFASIVTRGLGAMLTAIQAASNLEPEDRAKLIAELRRTGEAVVGVASGADPSQPV